MKRFAVLALIFAAALQAAATPQYTLKVGVDLVNVLFTVTDDNGRLIPGLSREDFLIEEEGKKQDILHFSRENELPLTLGILIDTSPSVRPIFEEEKEMASQFIRSVLRPKDLAMVIGFERQITLMQDYTSDVTSVTDAIGALELGPERGGGTSLYDAVYLAAKDKLQSETGRKAIILISDGEDTTSKVKQYEALIEAHQGDVVIYSMAIRGRGLIGRVNGDPDTLERLSEETGGGFYQVRDREDLGKAFSQIEQELRSQYSLGYVSSNPAKDGKYRRIRIIPRDSDMKIKARKGYYAPKPRNSNN